MVITLDAARQNAGLTRKEVSKQVNISVYTLRKLEKDSSNISKQLFDELTDLYGVDEQDSIYIGSKKEFLYNLSKKKRAGKYGNRS